MSAGPAAPDDRGQDREAVPTQRVRVGAIGLACVFLLVMLATALLHAAADQDLANRPAVAINAAEPAEPLAQLGVAPGNAPDNLPPGGIAPAPSGAPVPAPPPASPPARR